MRLSRISLSTKFRKLSPFYHFATSAQLIFIIADIMIMPMRKASSLLFFLSPYCTPHLHRAHGLKIHEHYFTNIAFHR